MAVLMCFEFQSIFSDFITGCSYYTYLIAQVYSPVRPCLQAINAVHSIKNDLMNADNHVVMKMCMYFHRSFTSFIFICCLFFCCTHICVFMAVCPILTSV